MPPPSATEFWSLLVESGLLDADAMTVVRREHEASGGAADVKEIARWLVGRGLITPWQAKRLVIGNRGPFFIGEYRLLERRGSEGEAHRFTARHDPSGRAVGLVLLAAKVCRKLDVWTAIISRTTAASRAASPMLSRTWSLEQHGGNRIIICEHVVGESLAEELDAAGPLPERQAGVLVSQVAKAVAELQELGFPHGGVSLETLIREPPTGDLPRTGRVRLLQFPQVGDPHLVRLRPWHGDDQLRQLGRRAASIAPELLHPGLVCDPRTDVYAIGTVLAAVLVGRPPFWTGDPEETLRRAASGPDPRELATQGVSPGMATLICRLLAADPDERPPNAAAAAALIAAHFGLAAASPIAPPAVVMPAARQGEARLPTGSPGEAGDLPDFSGLGGDRGSPGRSAKPSRRSGKAGLEPPLKRPVEKLRLRRTGQLRLLGGLITFAILAAAVGIVASQIDVAGLWGTPQVAVRPSRQTDDPRGQASDRGGPAEEPEGAAGSQSPQPDRSSASPRPARSPPRQVVIDDPALPWAAPTAGPRPTLAFLPPGSQLVLLARPAQLTADAEGELFLKSLGSRAAAGLEQLAAWSGGDASGIEFVQAGWQAGEAETVLGGYAIRLKEGRRVVADGEGRPSAWGPTVGRKIDGETAHVGKTHSFWLPSWEAGRLLVVAPNATITTGLAIGEPSSAGRVPLIDEIVRRSLAARDRGSAALQVDLPLELERLVDLLDADRHLTLFGSPHYLLTRGRAVLAGPLAKLAEPLEEFFGESLKAAAFSLHFADNCYLELDAIATLDMPAKTLAPRLAARVEGLADAVEAYCATLNPHPYGRVLVMRLPTMLRALVSYMRFGAEGDGVVINAYLPRHAAHNLALAGELALAQTPGAGIAVPPAPAGPPAAADALGTLEQKITLVFAKDTLEKAIQLVSEEIGVPMEIVGPDLQLEGITKNQSFGLDERDRSARDVLATILAKADPAGRLVYVVRKEDGVEGIFVTTRAAAAKRNEQLPPGQEADAGR
jgi:hypothetical protein